MASMQRSRDRRSCCYARDSGGFHLLSSSGELPFRPDAALPAPFVGVGAALRILTVFTDPRSRTQALVRGKARRAQAR